MSYIYMHAAMEAWTGMGIGSGGVGVSEGRGCGNLCSVKISCILGIALQTCKLRNSVDEEPSSESDCPLI